MPQATKDQKNYIEIPIPKLNSLKSNTFTLILVLGLVVGAYFLGVMTTKVQYLEKGGSTVAGTQTGGEATAQTGTAPPNTAPVKVDVETGHLPSLGEKDAKVTIVEFSDFQCPFCKRYFDDTFAQLKKDYIDTGKVVYYFRHYPLAFHANAQKAAEASECVHDQDASKFWPYHDELFKTQTEWENKAAADAATHFATLAGNVGVNTETFNSCLSSGQFAKNVTDDFTAGQTATVDGTPSFFINSVKIVGAQPYDALKAEIDKALNS